MKHLYRFWALALILCMIFPLSACFGEGAEVTTEPPLTSAEATTAEETLPSEEETTTLYDTLAEMEPLALLRYAAKKTRNYRTYVKTTEVTLNIPKIGESTRETVYMKNRDDYSQKILIDDELESFFIYSGGEVGICESFMGPLVYLAATESENQYKKIVGNIPTVKNKMLYDFSGNDNFSDGIVSQTDDGFIVSIDLSDAGKKELLTELGSQKDVKYTVGKATVVAFIDKEGTPQSVSFEADITIEQFGEAVTISIATHSSITDINEDFAVVVPEEFEVYKFDDFDIYYDFLARALYNGTRTFSYGYDFGFSRELRINKIANNSNTELLKQTAEGRYVAKGGLNHIVETSVGGKTTCEEYYYVNEDRLVYHIKDSGEAIVKHNMSAQDIYDMVVDSMFGNYVGRYDTSYPIGSETSHIYGYYYVLQIEQATAMDLAKKYLALCGIDPEKCDEIKVIDSGNRCAAATKNDEFSEYVISLYFDVKYQGKEFKIMVTDELDQFASAEAHWAGLPEGIKP